MTTLKWIWCLFQRTEKRSKCTMLMDSWKFGNPKSTFLEIRQPGQAQNLRAFRTKQNNETNSVPPLRLFIDSYMEQWRRWQREKVVYLLISESCVESVRLNEPFQIVSYMWSKPSRQTLYLRQQPTTIVTTTSCFMITTSLNLIILIMFLCQSSHSHAQHN